ncbi:flavodoxin family protein [bacterium]|nr:flavodoxin family protein [bacterium]
MRTLVICISIHHKNTEIVAKEIAEVLSADLLKPNEVEINTLSEYDLIGFGSGIYFGEHHRSLLNLIDKLPDLKGKKVFIFSTSGMSNAGNYIHNVRHRVSHFHTSSRERLVKKGFDIIGEFTCRGFDTAGPFKLIGGISKGRPNENDLENARGFAKKLKGSPNAG